MFFINAQSKPPKYAINSLTPTTHYFDKLVH